MTVSRTRRISAAALALALGTAGILAATPASAVTERVLTTDWWWSDVTDEGMIGDAFPFYEDYLGSGVDVEGFTDDAFDDFLQISADVTYGVTTLPLDYAGVSRATVGGLTTIVASATADFGDGVSVVVQRTLELQGSFARWSWTVTPTGATAAEFTIVEDGNLGSDEDSVFLGSGATRVSYEDGGNDPIIGYSFANMSPTVADGDDDVVVTFTGDQAAVLTVALWDFDPCSFDAALAAAQAALPTLAADFGDALGSFYAEDCLTVETPALVSGATDQRLDIIESADLESNWDYLYGGAIADPEDGLTFVVLDAPAGLSFSLVADDVDNDEPQLRMAGSPTTGGEVRLLFYYTDGDNFYPLEVAFDVEVGLAATGPSDVAPAVLGVAAAFLGAGALLLVARRRFARR
ncbi:MAG: hypothetical protein LDL15_04040 [Yonghaparkia sp.]|nr:hypothetical protein [Microcella sp.]